MKKMIALLLASVLVVGVLAACSSKQTDTDPSSTVSTQNATEDTGVASNGNLDPASNEAEYQGAASNGDLEFDYSDLPASNGNLAAGD